MYDLPPSAYVHYIEKTLSCDLFKMPLATIIKFPPTGDRGDKPYSELICSEKDIAAIEKLITNLAKHDWLTLFFTNEGTLLKQLGAQINHVHPLKFLSTIFKDPTLRSCMSIIADDYLKWGNFMEGLAASLTKEADKGKLELHLTAFCADIGIPLKHIEKYFPNRTWEALVRSLMHYPYPI
ncbi:MAG: hypothetical protein K2X08_04830 [Chlamydiales bacterium]|nr:hypothetical protein [Chlamydiales bacterium]